MFGLYSYLLSLIFFPPVSPSEKAAASKAAKMGLIPITGIAAYGTPEYLNTRTSEYRKEFSPCCSRARRRSSEGLRFVKNVCNHFTTFSGERINENTE